MNQESVKILQLLEDGKINSAEAMELLKTLDSERESAASDKVMTTEQKRALRVRVDGDKTKVNVNVPLSLIKVATQIAGASMQWIPDEAHEQMKKQGFDLTKIDFDELMRLIDQGLSDGKLVDVETEDEKEGNMRIEVYVE